MKVAIIGGGISGLTCAARLGQLGISDVTVFDTGKHAVGGRCSSRVVNIKGQFNIFDHAVQYFTVSDSRFKKIVNYLLRDGAVKLWQGPVGHLSHGRFQADQNFTDAYVGVNGMRSVAESLSKFCKVQRPGWVGNIKFDHDTKKWQVDKWGLFDYVVIAHNGKCAAKLTEQSGAHEIHRLCHTRFSSQVNPKDKRMTLCSLFVLMVAFEHSVKLPFEGAHVSDSNISWVANNSAKLSNTPQSLASSSHTGQKLECWTIISSKLLAEQNKVPQENIPPNVEKRISALMLASFGEVTGLKGKLPVVCFQRLQLWGAAVPLNTLASSSECAFDVQRQIGICSDWLVSPCLQGAAISGLAMAEAICCSIKGDKTTAMTSLAPDFKVETMNSPIGVFP